MNKEGRLLQLIFLGSAGVGKTSLHQRFCEDQPDIELTPYVPTINVDFKTISVSVESENWNVQIWDTAGTERFSRIGTNYYRGTDCCILVFDATNKQSFNDIDRWREEFAQADSSLINVPVILLGNKLDLVNHAQYSKWKHEPLDWAKTNGAKFVEVSAKTSLNIESAFREAVNLAIQNFSTKIKTTDGIELHRATVPQDQESCCRA